MEPTITDLEKLLKEMNKDKFTRKKQVNNFKNKKVKIVKIELPKGRPLY
jgi:hypothetical protein